MRLSVNILRRRTTNEHPRNHKDLPTFQVKLISSLSVRERRERTLQQGSSWNDFGEQRGASEELQSHEEEHAARRDPLGPGEDSPAPAVQPADPPAAPPAALPARPVKRFRAPEDHDTIT
ncbi:translation initiation factor IF-2-like [Pseudoliparis swirei]|uniref:translation initiation factor IF-2-like n=1 Tax=Pseudoliparis swirei TaxID=2059687 RepID=UPI0024BE2AAD|nr:translation initiation factor IF-2-like [Pseudoliparis swirei]